MLLLSLLVDLLLLLLQCGPKIQTYPWPAEDLVACVSRQSGFSAAAVERPTVVQNPLFPLALLAFIVVGGFVAWKLYNSPLVRITGLWTLGALGVYWFATSGGMYNIIRGVYGDRHRAQHGKRLATHRGRRGPVDRHAGMEKSSRRTLAFCVPVCQHLMCRSFVLSLYLSCDER